MPSKMAEKTPHVGVMTFLLYLIPVRRENTRFRVQIWGDISAILEGHACMADSKGCERNPFAQDVFRPKVAYMQIVRNQKSLAHMGSVLSDIHS